MIRISLTLLSAGLGILSFPPFDGHFQSLIALLPFLLALRGSSNDTALALGLLYGLVLYVGTLPWMVSVFGAFAFLLHFILALFPAFFARIFIEGHRRWRDRPWLPWFAATLWTGIEHFRCEWFSLRFAWITPGTGLPPGYLTPVVGVYGVTFLIVLGCASIAWTARFRPAGIALLIALGSSAYLPKPAIPVGDIAVAAVQSEDMSTPLLFRLSQNLPEVDAIVWPEYVTRSDLRRDEKLRSRITEHLAAKSAEVLVLGGRAELDDGKWQNTAYTIGHAGVLGTHVKNRPVHFFDDGEPGTEAPAIATPLGLVGTPVCFDNDYAAVQRRAVANGAEFLLIPSMDAEHWTARQHLQHAELFRHRAAENGRFLVVAASSGLTQAIDPWGRRISSLPLFEPGVMNTRITARSHRTPYQRCGWLIGPACTILSLGWIALPFLHRRWTRFVSR